VPKCRTDGLFAIMTKFEMADMVEMEWFIWLLTTVDVLLDDYEAHVHDQASPVKYNGTTGLTHVHV